MPWKIDWGLSSNYHQDGEAIYFVIQPLSSKDILNRCNNQLKWNNYLLIATEQKFT